MGNNRKRGPSGTKHNSPVIDSGTLSRSTSPSRQPLGLVSPATPSKNRRVGWKSTIAPKGYVIVDNSVKNQLSNRTWEYAKNRINDLFQKAGGLEAVYVKTSKDLPYLNLTDGVVKCHLNSNLASNGFRINVYNPLNGSGHKLPAMKSLAGKFNHPEHYGVDVGRSYTVKGIFQIPPYIPQLVCITYGVISMKRAFTVWSGLLVKNTKTTLATISRASQAEQLSFGIALGNLIAHELRHQLGLSKTGQGLLPIHTGSGLGMDGADFNNPKIRFTDEAAILASLAKLRIVQNKYIWSRL